MVGTICPMVHGARTKPAELRVLLAHVVGSLSGSALIGVAGGTLGAFLVLPKYRALALGATAFLSLLYGAGEELLERLPHPQSHFRVPPHWRQLPPSSAAALYGFGLGLGVATPIQISGFYVVLVWTLAVANPVVAAIALLGFGLGRAMPILVLSKLRSPELALSKVEAISWNLSMLRFANSCALLSAAVILFFNAMSG